MPTSDGVQIRILSAGKAQEWIHGWPTVVVSLVGRDTHLVATTPRPDLRTLRLLFADVTDPDHPAAATEEDVAQLIALGRSLTDGDRALFHCRGGIGRSPAAAAICLVAAGWSPRTAIDQVVVVRPQAKPNAWLVLLADRALTPSLRGGIFSAYVQWAQRQDWWHPLPGTITQDAIAGRLSWNGSIDLVKAQTHRLRDVDHGPHREPRG